MLENLTHPLQCPIFKATKKVVGGADPQTRTKHPHHQKRENRETPTHKQASTPRSTHSKKTVGSALLSHNPPVAVPSAQKGLTSRFGKDTGCNPLAKTTNTTKQATPQKRDNHSPVSETNIHLTTQPLKAVLVVNRTVDANTIKQTPTKADATNYC